MLLKTFIRLLNEDDSLTEVRWMVLLIAVAEDNTGWSSLEEQGNPEHFKRYEDRLGNTQPGDGYRYRGRGYLMLTGQTNYERMGRELGLGLLEEPDLLLKPEIAYRALSRLFVVRPGEERKLGDFLAGDKTDYHAAALAMGADRRQAERITRAAREIEPLVRSCLVKH